jgi:hypothetical protein
MSEELDRLLQRLAARGPERSLDGLDARVLISLAQQREEARATTSLAPFRVATVGLAIAVGVTAGGMAAARTATEPRQFSTFSADAHLAPSTLLEGGK